MYKRLFVFLSLSTMLLDLFINTFIILPSTNSTKEKDNITFSLCEVDTDCDPFAS